MIKTILTLMLAMGSGMVVSQIKLPKFKTINNGISEVNQTVNNTDKLNKDIKTAKGDKKDKTKETEETSASASPKKSGSTTSDEEETKNPAFTYDAEGYIIRHPKIMEHLNKQEKYYYVTEFDSKELLPYKVNSPNKTPYDYAYIEKIDDGHGAHPLHPVFVNKTKQENPYVGFGYSTSVLDGGGYFHTKNKLYVQSDGILSFEPDGGVLLGFFNENKLVNLFYLAPTELAAKSASSRFSEFKGKAEEYRKTAAQEQAKKDYENKLQSGLDEYNTYFKPKYKPTALEPALLKVATTEGVVTESEKKKYGTPTIKKIAQWSTDWGVMKNGLGVPTHKQLDCYAIGTFSGGGCFIKCISFLKEYEGGGKYSNTIHIESECVPTPIPCDKVK